MVSFRGCCSLELLDDDVITSTVINLAVAVGASSMLAFTVLVADFVMAVSVSTVGDYCYC